MYGEDSIAESMLEGQYFDGHIISAYDGYTDEYGNIDGGHDLGMGNGDQHEDPQNEYQGGPPPEGMWVEHSTMPSYSNRAVTVLEYDNNLELLWAGYDDGRVTSFAMTSTSATSGSQSDEYDTVQPQRYSSFTSSDDAAPITQLVPLNSCVASVSANAIRMHSVGGLTLGRLCDVPYHDATAVADAIPMMFTCAAALRPSQALVTANNVGLTHLIVGTNTSAAYAYDINVFGGEPLLEYDTGSPAAATVCVRASDAHLALAGADGKVRLLDTRLRSRGVQHTLEAHSGPVRDMCLQPDGVTMLTCGVISRPVNPYDPKSPVNYLPDPLVKVFDLRMRRQLTPMSMSTSSPSLIRFVPRPPHHPGAGAGTGDSSILLGSASGILQVSPVIAEMDPAATQILYAPLQERGEQVTAAAVARSGHFMCVGTSGGTIAQYMVGLSTAVRAKVNTQSSSLVIPPYPAPPPPVSVSPRALVLAGSYVTRPRSLDPSGVALAALSMASSYHSTPAVRTRRLRLTSARRLSEEMVAKTHQQDFIGTVPNPGFRGNSMLYGAPAKRAYATCDPRKRLEQQQQLLQQQQQLASKAGGRSGGLGEGEGGGDVSRGRGGDEGGGVSSLTGAGGGHPSHGHSSMTGAGAGAGGGYASTIPASVRKIHSHRGKQVGRRARRVVGGCSSAASTQG